MSKYLVEESWVISVSALRKDLKKIRGDEKIEGHITLRNKAKYMQAVYWSIKRNGEKYLAVAVPNTEPKEIGLETIHLTYGPTSLFKCPSCAKRCTKLYVHPEIRKSWRCVRCNGLKYHLQSFNPYSMLGVAEYKMDQMEKWFARKRPRMFYAGRETKPFQAYMKKMYKLGLAKEMQAGFRQIEEYKKLSQRISIISDYLGKGGNLAVGR